MGLLTEAGREFRTAMIMRGALREAAGVRSQPTSTLADYFERVVDDAPDAPAICWEGNTYSFRELDEAANRLANWATARGIGRGDRIALLMQTRPEYVFAWLAMAKIGAEVALPGAHLGGVRLRQAVAAVEPRLLLVGAEVAQPFSQLKDDLPGNLPAYSIGARVAGCRLMDPEFLEASPDRPDASAREGVEVTDTLFYTFSMARAGTPRAAKMSHGRFVEMGKIYAKLGRVTRKDRILCVLPLTHASGGIVAAAMALTSGASLLLQERFSSTRFWSDCFENDVSVIQYGGELCRYLTAAPESAYDRKHSVRCAVGTGMRRDVWEQFQTRFGVRRIVAYYAATEGGVGLLNVENRPGSLGRVPRLFASRFPVELVRYDESAGGPVRDEAGRCVRCELDEPGEALGRVGAENAFGGFEGFRDEGLEEELILRDVFEEGDAWYRTGDLLQRDGEGYLYYVDRIGDTFQWKSRRVWAGAVADRLTEVRGVRDASVSGVGVVGYEGRAPMACVLAAEGFDVSRFSAYVERMLEAHERPVFIRVRKGLDMAALPELDDGPDAGGFDPDTVHEPLFVRDAKERRYVKLDRALFERIIVGDFAL